MNKKTDSKGNKVKGDPKVRRFSDFVAGDNHRRFDEYIDRDVYIIKIEPQTSEQYGEGFKVWFKEAVKAKDTYTAAVYGQYVVPQLDELYKVTHDGKLINPDNPVMVTIRKAGKTYRFE